MLNMYRIFVFALLLCVGRGAFAQDGAVTMEAELSRGRAYVGDVVTYQVRVRGTDDGRQPEVVFPKNVRAEYRGASSRKFTQMRSVNGRQRAHTDSYYEHQYLLTILDDGEVLVPSAVLVLGSKKYSSNVVTMDALLPAKSVDDILEIVMPERAVYVGESVLVHVRWWVAGNTRGLNFEPSVFPKSMRVTAMSPEQRSGQEVQLEIGGQRINSYVEDGVHQGRAMKRLSFDLMVTPTRVGDEEFGPVRVVFTRLDDFGQGKKMYAQADTVEMRVIDVPSKGRPAGYRGLIGSFMAQTDASNQQVNVGDPIEFRLLVSGSEPMIGLEKTLNAQSLERDGFRVSPDGWREVERRRSGERLFVVTIRATDDGVEEIPAIELPAFNPESGEFEVFASEPIALDVRAVRTVTLSDAIVAGGLDGAVAGVDREELMRNPSVLWARPDVDAIRESGRAFSLGWVLRDPVWIGVLGLIVLMPVVAAGVGAARRSRDPRAAAIERAWKRAKRLHGRGDDVGAIRVYGGAVLGIEPGSLTGADLARLGVSEDIARRSASVLTESEGMAYGAMATGQGDASLLREMRRDIRQHGAGRTERRAMR